MFERFRRKSITTTVNNFSSLVGAGMTIHGPVNFSSTLKVDGAIHGDVKSDGKSVLVIGKVAFIYGNIECDVVIVEGTVNGTIKAREVCFHDTASFNGEFIEYDILKVSPGAVLHNAKLIKKSLDQSETSKIPDQSPSV